MTRQTPSSTRFTRADIELINSALALYEADHEGEEPDLCRDDDEIEAEHAAWLTKLDRIRAMREKIHARRRTPQ